MFKAIVLTGFAALVAAQSSVLTFTHVPNPITDGQAQAITYATNDTTTPVSIILRKGASNDLQTVMTLTSSATAGQYIWTPSDLPDGVDYALEIQQGSQLNYFGPFAIQGASASASISTSHSGSATVAPSGIISSTVSANGTASTTVPIAPGTLPGTAGSMSAGTGTAMMRNTTMSKATLTGSSTASMTASGPSSNSAAATSGAGFQGSSTASAASSSSTSKSGAEKLSGAAALVFGVAAAAFYLQ